MNYKKLLVAYGKKLLDKNLVAGTSGNLSLRGQGDEIYITPSGMDYLEITEDDIVKINFMGEILEGDKKPSSEWMMHVEIYKNYPKYNAIVHTHSPIATAFAVSRKKIPLILIEMKPFLGGKIEYCERLLKTIEGMPVVPNLPRRYLSEGKIHMINESLLKRNKRRN